jgi:hypothetical protein
MNRVIAAAALAAAAWGVKRWLDQRYVQIAPAQRNQTETWENEGGALSPHAAGTLSTHAAGLETSQVAR